LYLQANPPHYRGLLVGVKKKFGDCLWVLSDVRKIRAKSPLWLLGDVAPNPLYGLLYVVSDLLVGLQQLPLRLDMVFNLSLDFINLLSYLVLCLGMDVNMLNKFFLVVVDFLNKGCDLNVTFLVHGFIRTPVLLHPIRKPSNGFEYSQLVRLNQFYGGVNLGHKGLILLWVNCGYWFSRLASLYYGTVGKKLFNEPVNELIFLKLLAKQLVDVVVEDVRQRLAVEFQVL
jgi:hypothetical protein